jgi:hypothetical protein
MRAIWLAVLLVGCVDGRADLHEQISCTPQQPASGEWTCDLPCDSQPATDSVQCKASNPDANGWSSDPVSLTCARTFEFDGQRGCCYGSHTADSPTAEPRQIMRFYTCD